MKPSTLSIPNIRLRCVLLSARVLLSALTVTVVGCGGKEEAKQKSAGPTELAVAPVVMMPIVQWDSYTGRLDAIDSVDVRARVSGYLQSTHFDEGQMVDQGDLLAIIDPRPFQAELAAAKARVTEAEAMLRQAQSQRRQAEAVKAERVTALKLALRRLDRQKQLDARGATSEERVDEAEAESAQAAASIEAANAEIATAEAGIATAEAAIQTARAGRETADLNLHYTEIRAPISGRISRRFITQGNLINGGSAGGEILTRIVTLNPIHAYFDANEQEFLKYVRLANAGKRGSSRDTKNPVLVSLVDEEDYPHRGHMDFVDNRVDPNTGTMRGRAILPNDDGVLTPGLFVEVRLPGSGRYEAVMVPDAAIGSDQSEKFVYVIRDGRPVRQAVVPGPVSHGLRIIEEGLTGDDKIVIRGLQSIRPASPDGPPVEYKLNEEPVEPEPSELPDEYQPVPKDQWLTRTVNPMPPDVPQNAQPYQTLRDENGDLAQ